MMKKIFILFLSLGLFASTVYSDELPTSFDGKIGDKLFVGMSLQRNGDEVQGYYFYLNPCEVIYLKGKIGSDGAFKMDELDAKGNKTGTWQGSWKDHFVPPTDPKDAWMKIVHKPGAHLSGKWEGKKGKDLSFDLQEIDKDSSSWTAYLKPNYVGSINNRYAISFHIQTKDSPSKLTGVYRYNAKTGKLDWKGKIISGKGDIELTESDDQGNATGIWRGKIMAERLDGVWINPKTKKTMHFSLHAVEENAFQTVDWAGLFQVKTIKKNGKIKGCEFDSEYDQLSGTSNQKILDDLNHRLLELGDAASECTSLMKDAVGSESNYDVQQSAVAKKLFKARYLLVESNSWSFTGGAHGSGSGSCDVFDLITGKQADLSQYFTDAGKQLLKKRIIDEIYEGDESASQVFVGKDFKIKNENICPTGEGLRFAFSSYEVAAYADGDPSLSVKKKDWKKYFTPNEVTEAVFGK